MTKFVPGGTFSSRLPVSPYPSVEGTRMRRSPPSRMPKTPMLNPRKDETNHGCNSIIAFTLYHILTAHSEGELEEIGDQ